VIERAKHKAAPQSMPLMEVYHRAREHTPTDRAAQIAVSEAWETGRIWFECERFERKAGEEKPTPVVIANYRITERDFSHWDWERSYATRIDPATKSHFEYKNIRGGPVNVILTLWPTKKTEDVKPRMSRPGPPTTHDWFAICGEIARRCINPQTRTVVFPKSENRLAEAVSLWCEQPINVNPPIARCARR